MKKTIVLFLAVITMCLVLSACKCEHQYEEKVTTEASCTAVGVKTFTCTKCEESYTEEIPMVEHAFGKATVTKEATCAEEGEMSVTCSVCGTTKVTDTVPKTKHEYTSAVTTDPTCTVEGVKTYTCTGCEDSYTEPIEKIDHNYTSKVTTNPTCTLEGVETFTCKNCGNSYTQKVPVTDHNYGLYAIDDATCTTNGKSYMKCAQCGDEYTEIINATGHSWVAATCLKPKHCTNCEATEGKTTSHNIRNGLCQNNGCDYSIADGCNATIKPGPSANLVNYHIFHAERIWVNFFPTAYNDISMDVWMQGAFTYTQSDGICYDSYLVVVYDSAGNIFKSATIDVKGIVGENGYFSVYIGKVPNGEYTVEFRDAL